MKNSKTLRQDLDNGAIIVLEGKPLYSHINSYKWNGYVFSWEELYSQCSFSECEYNRFQKRITYKG